ncbi:UNVERIFIED_CONTAM: hypothetical protein Scaly_2811700 [Sesamum calycinum]|uniref:CID domain-containing protein n=1 Tax=Sesamum calycinum TaxID=2727403 RepID=A0AAW2IUD0_9LAMI
MDNEKFVLKFLYFWIRYGKITINDFLPVLSAGCMLHHKKADQIIATWDKHICCPEVVQRVPHLFLATDILPSNKTKVNRFITRFWKILPSALKELVENGKADERKAVFRLKLSIGGSAEKIVSAFELVLHEHANEDKEMRECKSAVHRVEKLEKDVDKALKNAKDSLRNTATKILKEEEENLEKSIDKLRSFEQAQATETANMVQCLGNKEDSLVVELKLPFANEKQANKSVSEMAAELADKLKLLTGDHDVSSS